MLSHRLLAVATAVGLTLSALPARADWCLDASIDADNHFFFRFEKKYPTKFDKITAINGRVVVVEGGSAVGGGPAYGQVLGLPEGDAGNSIGITFMHGASVVGHAAIVLDDNGKTTGGGTVQQTPGGSAGVGGQIVDCLTEP